MSNPATTTSPPLSALAHRRRWATLIVLSLSLVLIGMDTTVLNTALPTLQRDLAATASELQWIIDAYTLVFAGVLLTAGSWGDKYGRRLALSAGLVIFGAAAAWGATADSPTTLIAARAAMGLGGALIMPSTLSVLIDVFRDPAERKRAIGIWSATAGIGIAAGPALGGWLLEHYSWGAVLLVNIPVVVVALALGFWLIPESRDQRAPRLDLVGAALSSAGLAILVWSFIEAPERGWTDPVTLGGMAGGLAILAGFVGWERRTAAPMLPIRFFRNRRFSVPAAAIGLDFFALMGAAFFLSVYLQTVLGYDALDAGLRILPLALGLVVGSPLAMAVAQRIGEKWPTVFGLTVIAASFWIFSGATAQSDYAPRSLVGVILLGFGMAFAMGPATESVMGSVPRSMAGVGSAVNDTVRQVGGALGVAVLISIMNSAYASSIAGSVTELPADAAAAAEDSIQGAYGVAGQLAPDVGAALVSAADTAFVDAMSGTVLAAGAVALLGALITLIWMPSHARPADEPAVADSPSTDDAQLATVSAD